MKGMVKGERVLYGRDGWGGENSLWKGWLGERKSSVEGIVRLVEVID